MEGKRMKNPALWWFVSTGDGKFEYRKATLDELVKEFNDDKISDYTIVHPENLIYDKELRNYNKKHIKYINNGYVHQLTRLFELKAPECVLAGESIGVFSKSKNLLEQSEIEEA